MLSREQDHKEDKERLEARIEELCQELEAMKRSRALHKDERTEMEEKARQAERHANRWHLKYNQLKSDLSETKDVILLYENLLDKLTEQNVKLKDWIKTKKEQDRLQEKEEQSYPGLTHLDQFPDSSECPTPSAVNAYDYMMPSSFQQTRVLKHYQPS